MQNEEILRIIDDLQARNSYVDAVIGFHQYGGGPDESFIKANRQGLELFAAELLKAALETEKSAVQDQPAIYHLEMEEWTARKTEYHFGYIELQKAKRDDIFPSEDFIQNRQSRLSGTLTGFGCVLLILILGICCFIGILSVLRWIL